MAFSTSFDGDGRQTFCRPMEDRPIFITEADVEEFRIAMENYKQPEWSAISRPGPRFLR